jgi:hypothetical protein
MARAAREILDPDAFEDSGIEMQARNGDPGDEISLGRRREWKMCLGSFRQRSGGSKGLGHRSGGEYSERDRDRREDVHGAL